MTQTATQPTPAPGWWMVMPADGKCPFCGTPLITVFEGSTQSDQCVVCGPLTHRRAAFHHSVYLGYKNFGKAYLHDLKKELKATPKCAAPTWVPRCREELFNPWPAKKPPAFLLRSGLGRWLAVLVSLAKEHAPVALQLDAALKRTPAEHALPADVWAQQRIARVFQVLLRTEKRLNTRGSSLEELVVFDALTAWLCEQILAEDHAAQLMQGYREGQNFHRPIQYHAQKLVQTITKMRAAQGAEWQRHSEIPVSQADLQSGRLHGTAFGDISGMADFVDGLVGKSKIPFPSRLNDRRRVLQKQMLARGGPRLWVRPLVWVDAIGFAAAVLKRRKVTHAETYALLKSVWPVLFPMATDAFPTSLKTFYDHAEGW
jgi:hypothetical protein